MVTQADIARRVGIDVSSVNKILNGRKDAVFKKETVRKVFKVAREMGYDLGRVKYRHGRREPRKELSMPLEISIYRIDGTLYDRGSAMARNVSLSGALLSAMVLPHQNLPLIPHTIGIRLLDGPFKDVEIMGRSVRISGGREDLNLAVEFLETQDAKIKQLRKVLG